MWNIERLEVEAFKKSNKESDCYFGFYENQPAASIILSENNKFM